MIDVLDAEGDEAHRLAAERWARPVWNGWAGHHGEIRDLLAEQRLY